MSENDVPLCPGCGKPCKKARRNVNSFTLLNDGYYKTCGKPKCIQKARSYRDRKEVVGVKFVPPKLASIFTIYENSLKCHNCGKPKEIGRQACDSCCRKAGAKYAVWQKKLTLGQIAETQSKKAYKEIRRQEAVDFFDQLSRNAKTTLATLRKENQ